MRLRVFAVLACLCLVASLAAAEDATEGGWLGVMLGRAQGQNQNQGQAQGQAGVTVSGIAVGGPAARAGLRSRDVVLDVDGTPVASSAEMIERVRGLEPGSWITLSLLRKGKPVELRVRLGSRSAMQSTPEMVRGWLGLGAIELPESLRLHFGAPEGEGVMVSEIVAGSPAESAGFALGDVLYEIDGQPVQATTTLKSLVMGSGVGNKAELVLMRDGAKVVLEAVIELDPAQR